MLPECFKVMLWFRTYIALIKNHISQGSLKFVPPQTQSCSVETVLPLPNTPLPLRNKKKGIFVRFVGHLLDYLLHCPNNNLNIVFLNKGWAAAYIMGLSKLLPHVIQTDMTGKIGEKQFTVCSMV